MFLTTFKSHFYIITNFFLLFCWPVALTLSLKKKQEFKLAFKRNLTFRSGWYQSLSGEGTDIFCLHPTHLVTTLYTFEEYIQSLKVIKSYYEME